MSSFISAMQSLSLDSNTLDWVHRWIDAVLPCISPSLDFNHNSDIQTVHLGKKCGYEPYRSRLKHTYPAALNGTTELTAQHLSSYEGQTVSSSSSLTPIYPKRELIKQSSGLTSGGYPSGTKITEEETGRNPYCSAAAAGDPQARRDWSGPQQSYSRGA
ncbi:hypothetical protein AAY473_031535 [Plecturocebus cupreus]